MKPEIEFLKKLEAFLDEDFNEYSKNRILGYLEEYKESIPPIIIKKERVITDEIIKVKEHLAAGKQRVTQDMLMKEAETFCLKLNMTLDVFLDNSRKRSSTEVVSARKDFCKFILNKYYCSNNHLVKLVNVHHATVVFYLYGKKYFKRPTTQKITK